MQLLGQHECVSLPAVHNFKSCSLRLIAEREAEDAKKQKGAAEEEMSLESKSSVFKELEEPGAQSAPPPKEEASAVPAPAVTKVPTGTKRRRK